MSATNVVKGWLGIVNRTTQETLKPEALQEVINAVSTETERPLDKDEFIGKIVTAILEKAKTECLNTPEYEALRIKIRAFPFNPGFYRLKVYEQVKAEVNSLLERQVLILPISSESSYSALSLFRKFQTLITDAIRKYT